MNDARIPTFCVSQPMLDCLRMLAMGSTVLEIASEMRLPEPAIVELINDAGHVLSARNRVHAVSIALRKGLI